MKWILSINGLIMGLGALIILRNVIYKYVQIKKSSHPEKISLASVWLSGLISFFVGISLGIIERIKAFDQIAEMNNISPEVVARSIKGSLIYVIMGLALVILSIFFYMSLREMINMKVLKNMSDT